MAYNRPEPLTRIDVIRSKTHARPATAVPSSLSPAAARVRAGRPLKEKSISLNRRLDNHLRDLSIYQYPMVPLTPNAIRPTLVLGSVVDDVLFNALLLERTCMTCKVLIFNDGFIETFIVARA